MRYSKNEVKDKKAIAEFLNSEKFGTLGLVDEDKPYAVPVNFLYFNDKIYFHSARAGRRWDIIHKNANAFFVVARWNNTIPAQTACDIGTSYFSVMIEGIVSVVEDPVEKDSAFNTLIKKYVQDAEHVSAQLMDTYRSSLKTGMALFAIDIKSMSAKANPPTQKN
jgi:nitroimidazol reductase NimA-like FMN-containing flavoprotein (pyridoxamine 5'-phosphate oxidase superfamily)